jgi:hypothetical protein
MAAAAGVACLFLAKGRQRIDDRVAAIGVVDTPINKE